MFEIAIPTYNRPNSIFHNTIRALVEAGCNLNNVTVFLSDEDEYEDYKRELADTVKIVKSRKTLSANRNFILDYYPNGTKLMMMDDDLQQICILRGNKLIQGNINDIAQVGFSMCEKEGLSLWGIYAASNPFFMSQRITKGLFYIIGSCFGVIVNDKECLRVYNDEKEDYMRSLKTFRDEKGVIRLEYVTVKSKYYTQPGGMQTTRTRQRVKDAAEEIATTFPDYCKPYIRKSTGMYELRLNNSKYKTIVLK